MLAMLALAALLGGCGTDTPTGRSPDPAVPAEFQPACGQPGARVTVLAVPVTVAHAACDLVGVELTYGLASAVVPERGRAATQVETYAPTTAPVSIVITVAGRTGDVTVTG